MQEYIVQAGDTIFGVAKQFGVSVEEILNANNLTSNSIIPGQVLKIPSINSTSLYTVMPGDNLYEIAKKYNTTVNELMKLNNLSSTLLTVGEKLKVPGGSSNSNIVGDYQVYVVKSGDNLYEIANLYGMTVQELMTINNLTSTDLAIGQQLKVKNNQIAGASYEECYGEGYVEPKYLEYTVKKGDSLYVIANMFDTTIENLMSLNNLSSINLSIGQVLKVREV